MLTKIEKLTEEAHAQLCGVVAAMLPGITWRHAGFGAMQGYVIEGARSELRVHVWHPDLRKAGIDDSGICHDHRFDLRSTVLVGRICNVEVDINRLPADRPRLYQIYEVQHARAAYEASGGETYHADPVPLDGTFSRTTRPVIVQEGEQYSYPKGWFHETHLPDSGLVVTLVTKANQTDDRARIMAPVDRPLVHAFDDLYPPQGGYDAVIDDARLALLARWNAWR